MKAKKYEIPLSVKKNIWLIWHKLLIRLDKDISVNFINYGYENERQIDILKHDEPNRYCIQLYDQLVNQADLYNKDILEIGSGRGGGASYITRYYEPRSYTGLDISGAVTDFCKHYFSDYGLTFVKGDAAKLPFDKHSFDTLLSIESLNANVELSTFLKKAHRIIRKKGYFLFADIFEKNEIEVLRRKLIKCGFHIDFEKNITSNALLALDKDRNRRVNLINKQVPGFLKKMFTQFAGIKGTERYDSFTNGKNEYWSFVLRKN